MDETPLTAFLDTDQSTAATMSWTEEGRQCDRCGELSSRLWRQAEQMVCPECKDWSTDPDGSAP